MTWAEYLQGAEFLARSFNGIVPMDGVRVQRLSIYGHTQQIEFVFDFASFPPNLWDKGKYDTLQATFVFAPFRLIKVDRWMYSQFDGHPYCDVNLTKVDGGFRALFHGDVDMEILCEAVGVKKLVPYLRSETPIL